MDESGATGRRQEGTEGIRLSYKKMVSHTGIKEIWRGRMGLLLIIGFVALWLALQLYILPKLGIAT